MWALLCRDASRAAPDAEPRVVPAEIRRSGPHALRHAFITAALGAGVPLRDVQEAASHADLRTTMRCAPRASLDRHATYIVTAYITGATR
jgi:integrase/recombinase XerD